MVLLALFGWHHPVLKATAWLGDSFCFAWVPFSLPHHPVVAALYTANSAVVAGGQGRGIGLRYLFGEEKKVTPACFVELPLRNTVFRIQPLVRVAHCASSHGRGPPAVVS